MVKRRRRARGMTLIEVLISLLLGTVGLLGMLMLVLSLGTGSTFSKQVTEASVLGQSQLEQQVSMTGVTATNPPDSVTTVRVDPFGTTSVNGAYERETKWSTFSDGAGTRRKITVKVKWTDAANKDHFVYLERDKVPQ